MGAAESPPEIYDALATTSEGVIALYQMMSSPEPVMGREGGMIEELSDASLRKMMEDPRYWRDKDPSYVAKITKGFEKLYRKNKLLFCNFSIFYMEKK